MLDLCKGGVPALYSFTDDQYTKLDHGCTIVAKV